MRAASAIFSSRHGFVEVGPQPNDHLRHSVVLAPDVAEAALDSNRLRRCRTALYVRAKCARERLAHWIPKFLGYKSTEYSHAESYCCSGARSVGSRPTFVNASTFGINTETPPHVVSA